MSQNFKILGFQKAIMAHISDTMRHPHEGLEHNQSLSTLKGIMQISLKVIPQSLLPGVHFFMCSCPFKCEQTCDLLLTKRIQPR